MNAMRQQKHSDPPRLLDVAQRAGFSVSTVSRALIDKSLLKPETYERVAKALESLDYRRPRRNSASIRTRTVAVIVPSILDPFFCMLLLGIDSIAKTYNCNVLFFDSANSVETEMKNVLRFADSNIGGAILIPSGDSSSGFGLLQNRGIPVVLLDRTLGLEDSYSVTSDDEEGAYLATKYLIDLGHKTVLYVGGNRNTSTEKARLVGFRRAMEMHGVAVLPDLVTECLFDAESSYAAMSKIVSEKKPIFTAVFAANDLIALGVKKALEEGGLRVPQDVSLVGYGDMPFSSSISLTSVSCPAFEMGESALTLLIHIIEHKEIGSRKILLRPTLVLRSSCQQTNRS